jgi:hypothetical protein
MSEKKRPDMTLNPPKNTPDIEKAKEEFLKEAAQRKKVHAAKPSPSIEKTDEAQSLPTWTNVFSPWTFFESFQKMWKNPEQNPFLSHSFQPFVSAFFPWLNKPAKMEEPSSSFPTSQIVLQMSVMINVLEMILQETGLNELEKDFAAGKDIPAARKSQLKLLEKFREIQKQVQGLS